MHKGGILVAAKQSIIQIQNPTITNHTISATIRDARQSETVSWFGPQNQVGFGLSVAPQNQRRAFGAGHASRSSSLLGVEASLARVSQSGLKTGGGATTGGARGTIVEVASGAS
jgi:hypothetical protein